MNAKLTQTAVASILVALSILGARMLELQSTVSTLDATVTTMADRLEYIAESVPTETDNVVAADSCIMADGRVLRHYAEDTYRDSEGRCVHVDELREGFERDARDAARADYVAPAPEIGLIPPVSVER